jgi:hypothetical protein
MSRLERENRPEGSTLAKKQFQRMYHESLARQIQENNMKKIVQERGESMGNRPPPSIPGISAQQPYQQPQLFASYQPHDQQSHSESPVRQIPEYIPSNYNIQQQPDPMPRMASMPKQPIYPVPNGIYNTAIINTQKVAATSAPQPDLQAQKKAAYQKELLMQIEERKRREAEEKARKKQEDLLEMQRIQKEIEKEKREQEIAEEKAKQTKAGMAAQQDGFGMVKVPPPRKQTQQGSRAAAQQDVAQEGVMKPAAVLDTDVSKQYVMYTKQNQDVKQNNDAPQFNEPPQQPLQKNEPPPPEVKLAAPLSTDVSRQYLQQMGGGQGNQPNTVNKSPGFGLTAIKKEIHSELQKQLSSLQNPDGMLYQQINNKFQEGFVQIREDIQRANHELVSNLEKLKQETKVAAMERDKVVRELEDVKRARPNGNAPGSFGNAPFKKPFGGIDNDEIDSLLQRYGSKEALEGLNLDRREPVRPSRNIPAFEDQRQSNQMQDYRDFQATGQNEPKRYASQPIKMYNKNGQISQEQLMHGSINLDVIIA